MSSSKIEVINFLDNVTYTPGKPKVEVMLQTSFSKEIRIAFGDGVTMRKHTAPAPIVIQTLSGFIDLTVNDLVYQMPPGGMLALDANVPHSLVSIGESVVRLTLSLSDSAERVKQAAAE